MGSLKQLILFSFFLALLPLLVLLWQTQQSMAQLADIADGQARNAVDLTRNIELLQKQVVDLERLVRQYQIVEQAEIRSQIARRLVQLDDTLKASCQQAEFDDACDSIRTSLDQLDETRVDTTDDDFQRLNQQITQFEVNSRRWLDTRLEAQQQRVAVMQSRVTWQTLALLLITLLMVWGASQLLLGPIQALRQLVNAIGGQQALPAKGFKYPRELAQLDTRLRWLALRLQELESVRHAMLRHASHELKTPLASMIEGSSLLSEQVVGELNQEQQEVVNLLQGSVHRLSELIEELLDYNRLLQESQSRPQLLEVSRIRDKLIDTHKLNVKQQDMRLDWVVEAQQLWADKHLLLRIFDNLINNAIAYGIKGQPITVKVWQEQGQQFVQVSNFYEAERGQADMGLFEPFSRGNIRRNDGVKGSGLGLAIVADCVRMMQGKVELVSGGKGEFIVLMSLPTSTQEGEA